LGGMDIAAVRAAAVNVFAARATHDFPPTIRIPVEWQPELEALAKELGYPVTSAIEIENRFQNLVNLVIL
jgi:hypothetical protein